MCDNWKDLPGNFIFSLETSVFNDIFLSVCYDMIDIRSFCCINSFIEDQFGD